MENGAQAPVPSRVRKDIRIPVTILTGFLGSGKTTLVNRALRDAAMSRTAVVINEFGDISIDHALTIASNDTIVVLENGCLCCTVFGDLVQTLNRLYHAREAGEIAFDQVLIETSGLADIVPVIQAFLSEPTLEGLYRVESLIVTVDAVNAEGTLREHDVSVRQVALADYILLTKLDLIAPTARSKAQSDLEAHLRTLNRTALICAVDDAALDLMRLMRHSAPGSARDPEAMKAWLNAATAADPADNHHHTDSHRHDSSIASFSLIRDEPVPREALQLLLNSLERQLGPNLLRVKGIVHVAEEPDQPAVIQGAQHLLHNLTWLSRWPDADRRTRIVFITQGIPSSELAELVSLLNRVAQRTANARLRASSVQTASPT